MTMSHRCLLLGHNSRASTTVVRVKHHNADVQYSCEEDYHVNYYLIGGAQTMYLSYISTLRQYYVN